MASYQRIALFVFFDSIEKDMVARMRTLPFQEGEEILKAAERDRARQRISGEESSVHNLSDLDMLTGLDLGEKYAIILRHKEKLPDQVRSHYASRKASFEQSIQVRNSVMHGRPLTIDEYGKAFALAGDLIKSPQIWPTLSESFRKYQEDPQSLMRLAVSFIEGDGFSGIFNNLPAPDYDDTGFMPRPALEKELKKKILARHPVITVLGDGGNGKTAITLQTLYGLAESNDHGFDAIVWVSAKSSKLTTAEIQRIETAINSSLEMFEEVAGLFEKSEKPALERVRLLLEHNKILLVIDNLETILDDSVRKFAQDVPGESKLIFTSRVPLGSDLTVNVDPFSEKEAISYLRILTSAYNVTALKGVSNEDIRLYATRLGNKPLLLKWFALGVQSGLAPHNIVRNPKMALKFCLENVFSSLSQNGKKILSVMAQLPGSASQMIVQHVGDLQAIDVEAAFAELIQYALIEQTIENEYETTYRIKPFTKSYFLRVLSVNSADSALYSSRYRAIEGTFQSERGATAHDRFSIRTFIVRSKSEALAVRKLRQALFLAMKGEFEEAFIYIEDVKVSNPDYFEAYRCEAYVYYKQTDYVRSSGAYETAIELDPSQPQLYLFYGLFKMKAYLDYVGAGKLFDMALKIEPEALEVLRDAIRAKLYDMDYAGAQKYLDRARLAKMTSQRFAIIFEDLQLQVYYRNMEFLFSRKLFDDISEVTDLLIAFVVQIRREIIDETFEDHLKKAVGIIGRISREADASVSKKLNTSISEMRKFISIESSDTIVEFESNTTYEKEDGRIYGKLKDKGRQNNYAFIQSMEGVDTFIAKNSVSNNIWEYLLSGKIVEYTVSNGVKGKTYASDVRKIDN